MNGTMSKLKPVALALLLAVGLGLTPAALAGPCQDACNSEAAAGRAACDAKYRSDLAALEQERQACLRLTNPVQRAICLGNVEAKRRAALERWRLCITQVEQKQGVCLTKCQTSPSTP